MATRDRLSFYINNGEALCGSFDISQPAEVMWSSAPKANPNWTFVDGQGHWHAYSEDKDDRYPTLLEKVELVECDGSCGGACEGEGFHVTHYYCRICQEEVEPGSISGPHQFAAPGMKSWSATVEALVPDGLVSVRIEVRDKVYFGVAQCVGSEGSRVDDHPAEWKSVLVGTSALGVRAAVASNVR